MSSSFFKGVSIPVMRMSINHQTPRKGYDIFVSAVNRDGTTIRAEHRGLTLDAAGELLTWMIRDGWSKTIVVDPDGKEVSQFDVREAARVPRLKNGQP